MATNQILPFASTDTGTNLLTQAEYAADAQRTIGHQPGIARSKLENKALRQASLMAAGLAEFIADYQANNVTDGLAAQNIADYLLLALKSALGETPPVYDNDLSLATTAFVQRAIGNASGTVVIATSGTVTPENIGKVHFFNANNLTITLPTPANMVNGLSFKVYGNNRTGCSVVAGSGSTIYRGSGGTVSSVGINLHDYAEFISTDGNWYLVDGSTFDRWSTAFQALNSTNGYAKIANNTIIQWGIGSNITSQGSQVVNFPITFPNNIFMVLPGGYMIDAPSGADGTITVLTWSASNVTLYKTGGTTQRPMYIAIGN